MFWSRNKNNIRIVVFGSHSPDWMTAMAPSAPVWAGIPGIHEVLHVESGSEQIPPSTGWGQRTVVIPLMENHIKHRPTQYSSLAPNLSALQVLSNKAVFAAYVRDMGLTNRCPTVFTSIEEASFPCVIKRTDLNGGLGVEIAASLEHARVLVEQEPFAGMPYLIQSLVIHSGEYVAHCVCREGRILWHCVYAFEYEGSPVIRRPSMTTQALPAKAPPSLVAVVESFLVPLSFSGPCNIDYAIGEDGNIVVFEINPRLGGSLMCAVNLTDLRDSLCCIIQNALALSTSKLVDRIIDIRNIPNWLGTRNRHEADCPVDAD